MFRMIAEEIVFFLIKKGVLDNEKREIYEYAVEVILLNGSLLCTTLIISIAMKKTICYIFFLLFFVPLRITLGGMHMKSSGKCMLWSNVLYIAILLTETILYEMIGKYELAVFIVLCIGSMVFIISERNSVKQKYTILLIVIDLLIAFVIRNSRNGGLMIFMIVPQVLYLAEKLKCNN